MSFSERFGYKPVRKIIQIDSMNDQLTNRLWSLLTIYVEHRDRFEFDYKLRLLCVRIWMDFFKLPIDEMPSTWRSAHQFIRGAFFGFEWNKVYDFIEFVVERYPYEEREKFVTVCNRDLERECSAYRLVDGVFARITDEHEVAEIESVLDTAQNPVRTHLHRALELLSDRQKPDYRNSIKESISAVESLVSITLGQKGTLGQLIKKLEKEIGLHPALQSAFSNLYGYTSDEAGIRHAIMESKQINFEDAKFFLVVCSAFVNFVNARMAATQQ
jgi:AbiJ N-terminal domain 4